MPPQSLSLIARLAGLLGSPGEADTAAKSWLERRTTATMEEEEEEEEEEEQQLGHEGCSTHDEEDAPPQHAPSSYFDDQGGRVVRGSSFSASLDTVARSPALPTHQRGLSSMTDLGTGLLTLAEFVELLPAVLERCNTKQMRKCEPVKHLLERLHMPKETWERFVFWDPDKLYTRNLLATDNKSFTLLLLAWNAGRESPIHDHPCDGCWVKTLQGSVLETIYQMDPAQGRLVPRQENLFHPGELSYIEDSMGYHKVGNPDAQLGAVTLHVYIPPPRLARVWLPSKGTRPEDSMTVPTCLYSAFGKRVPPTAAEEAQGQGQGVSIMAPAPPVGAGEVVGSPPKQWGSPEKVAE